MDTNFWFLSATIHAAFATTTSDSQHEYNVHERFDLTVLRIFGTHRSAINICLYIYIKKRIYLGMHIQADQFFKILSDLTRLRVLTLLSREGELCVCELTHALGEIQPKISRHLALLREAGVVLDRRQGQWIYYRVNPELPAWARDVLMTTSDGVITQPPFNEDLQALTDMPNRPESACCA